MSPLHEDEYSRLAALEGLIPVAEGIALAELASTVPAGRAIVELGSFKGKSSCYIAAGARAGHGAHVWCCDPWDLEGNVYGKHGFTDPAVREKWEQQVASLGLDVTQVREFSTRFAARWSSERHLDGSAALVGMIFIDGDHEYASVQADYDAWSRHLAPGAIVAFDDYGGRNRGVTKFVEELRATRPDVFTSWWAGPEPLMVGFRA